MWRIADISREAMVDRVRDTFWLKDMSPAREQERDASVRRTIHREHQHTGRPLQGPRQPERSYPAGRDLLEQMAELAEAVERLGQEEQFGDGWLASPGLEALHEVPVCRVPEAAHAGGQLAL